MAVGIYSVECPGTWAINEELQTCVVRPPTPPPGLARVDASRVDAVSLTLELFRPDANGFAPVQEGSNKAPVLVVFPELAFGSQDFAAVNAAVQQLNGPVIVVAGFGLTRGAVITEQLGAGSLLPSWAPGDVNVAADALYNGGWCWAHAPGEGTRAWVFLKNRPEQTFEKQIANAGFGATFLCLTAGGVQIYPVICFDFVDSAQGGFAEVTRESRCGKRSVVAVLASEGKPWHPDWSSALGRCVSQPAGIQSAAIISNGAHCGVHREEAKDAWRALCGGFIARATMPKPPFGPPPFARYVVGEAAGLVLREDTPGAATGPLCWLNQGSAARNVWNPRWRLTWTPQGFRRVARTPHAQELDRFIRRHADGFRARLGQSAGDWVDTALTTLRGEVLAEGADSAGLLLDSVLNGLDESADPVHPDAIDPTMKELVRGLRALAVVRAATPNGTFDSTENRMRVVRGDNGHEYSVWFSPALSSSDILMYARELAEDGASAPPTVLIAQPNLGTMRRERIRSPRDAAVPEPEDSIGEPRERQVFVIPLGELEEALVRAKDPMKEVQSVLVPTG